jgi:protein phosphatase 2C family protein 2/3
VSTTEIGIVKAYSVVTTDGIFRKNNEDRVSILQNIVSKQPIDEKCSFFGVYDGIFTFFPLNIFVLGHGGNLCSEFLKENLHKFILKNKFFPSNPNEAIKAGIQMADKYFLEEVTAKYPATNAGSCAIFILVIGRKIYVANVGDSRLIGSYHGGKEYKAVSRDHKPCDKAEYERVMKAGGQVYQSLLKGPYRIFPGRLSVSRSLGDAQAKIPAYGGNPGVLITDPE